MLWNLFRNSAITISYDRDSVAYSHAFIIEHVCYYVCGVANETPRSSNGSSFYDWHIIYRCNLYDSFK